MICLERKVKWWKVANEYTHVFLTEDTCIEFEPGLYAEFPDGTRKYYSQEHGKLTRWKWEMLNDEEKLYARELYEKMDVLGMMKFHNDKLLSGSTICCDSDSVRCNYKAAIQEGKI